MGTKDGNLTTHTVFPHVWAPALAVLLRPQSKNTVMHFAHHKLAQFMSVVNYPKDEIFIRSFNQFNDSTFPKVMTNELVTPDGAMKDLLKSRFAVELDEIQTAYRAVTARSR